MDVWRKRCQVAALWVALTLVVMSGAVGSYAAHAGSVGVDQKAAESQVMLPILITGYVIAAEKIAYAGHGLVFDSQMTKLELDTAQITKMQDSMLAEIDKAALKPLPNDLDAAVSDALKYLQTQQPKVDDAILLKGGMIGTLLDYVPAELTAQFAWRNASIITQVVRLNPIWQQQINPNVLELLQRLGFFRPAAETDYIADCRAHDVPIPPDWAESGTAWVLQGTLTQNLLSPSDFAAVWTYSDPALRGACIALPRGSGGVGSAAGIICQSATTGHACFWDNKLRSVSPEQFIGWSGLTLDISELRDGSNLGSACTGCHRGNNVYLISPDDPTWAKVLRGPLNGPSTGTFTTRVETSSDNRGGHPRYVPISDLPERPGWENALPTGAGCAGTCHEMPVVSAPPMPPGCATSPTDPSGCYGTP